MIIGAQPGLAPAQQQSRPALSDMTETERATLRTEIRAYLLEYPLRSSLTFGRRQSPGKLPSDKPILPTLKLAEGVEGEAHLPREPGWRGGDGIAQSEVCR